MSRKRQSVPVCAFWSNSLDALYSFATKPSRTDAGRRAVPSLRAELCAAVAARAPAGGGARRASSSADGRERGELVAAPSGRMGQDDEALASDIALRVHVDVPQDLITHVAAGLVDIAIMYAPQHRPGLEVDLLLEEELVLATTSLETYRADDPQYVHVEWGPDFSLHHSVSFPDITPSLVSNLGPLSPRSCFVGGRLWLLPNACCSTASGIWKTPSCSGSASLLIPCLRRSFNECRSRHIGCGSHCAACSFEG